MNLELLRRYEPDECGKDGYPFVWHRCPDCNPGDSGCDTCGDNQALKAMVRDLAGFRCVRCGHPYAACSDPQWSPCDGECEHGGPLKIVHANGEYVCGGGEDRKVIDAITILATHPEWIEPEVLAEWRVLTTHHLTGEKADCRWWNLASLCQRCHLRIQTTVQMDQIYVHEHTDWFKPYAAGYYAAVYLGEDLTREQTLDRLDELLALEHTPTERTSA